MLSKLDDICGNSLYCDVADLEAICGEILRNQHMITNELYRKKRSTKDFGGDIQRQLISLYEEVDSEKRHKIEITFNLLGKYKDEGGFVASDLIKQVNLVQKKIVTSTNSGELGKDKNKLFFISHFMFHEKIFQLFGKPQFIKTNIITCKKKITLQFLF